MKSIFEITFPDGISGYTLAELWEIYDKLGVEIHERQLVVEAKKHINKVIGNYSSIDAFLDAVKEMPELDSVTDRELISMWNDYYREVVDEQEENEIRDGDAFPDDFRVREDDLVK